METGSEGCMDVSLQRRICHVVKQHRSFPLRIRVVEFVTQG